MISEVAKEIFTLLNLACAAGLFLLFLVYLLAAQDKRGAIFVTLLILFFACLLNGIAIYFLM